jgi:translation initiation factor 2B subunit (eIF-2B alpha/beta/delta family)
LEAIDVEAVFFGLAGTLVALIEAGASRHEAAEQFAVSLSSAIRWMQRFVRVGSAAAKPSGGSVAFGGARAVVARIDCQASGFDPG